jgi:hypothetical protein
MVMMMSMVLQMVVMVVTMGYILYGFVLHSDERLNNGIAEIYSIFNPSFAMFRIVEDEALRAKSSASWFSDTKRVGR